MENEVKSLPITQFFDLFRAQKPALHCLLAKTSNINSRTVIADFNVTCPPSW